MIALEKKKEIEDYLNFGCINSASSQRKKAKKKIQVVKSTT